MVEVPHYAAPFAAYWNAASCKYLWESNPVVLDRVVKEDPMPDVAWFSVDELPPDDPTQTTLWGPGRLVEIAVRVATSTPTTGNRTVRVHGVTHYAKIELRTAGGTKCLTTWHPVDETPPEDGALCWTWCQYEAGTSTRCCKRRWG